MSAAGDPNRVIILTEDPPRPATFNGHRSLTQALVYAYYQGDIDSIRRIGAQAEERLAALAQPREKP